MTSPEKPAPPELPPTTEQLSAIMDFIGTHLASAEPWQEEGYSEGSWIEKREVPELRLENGSRLSVRSRKTLRGDEPDRQGITILTRNAFMAGLHLNGNGTVDVTAEVEGEELFAYTDVPTEEAMQISDSANVIRAIYKQITRMAMKPLKPFVPHALLESIIVAEPSAEDYGASAERKLSNLELGIVQKPLKNQDAALADERQHLYGVFDGLGGRQNSAVAARLAATTIQQFMAKVESNNPDEVRAALIEAINEADATIYSWEIAGKVPGATTATLAKLVLGDVENYLVWASVGDSRLYIKDKTGKLEQISKDEGDGHTLYKSIGTWFNGVEQHGIEPLAKGSDIVLVTDGITGDYGNDILKTEEISAALEKPSAQSAAEELLHISRKRDDKTAIVVRI